MTNVTHARLIHHRGIEKNLSVKPLLSMFSVPLCLCGEIAFSRQGVSKCRGNEALDVRRSSNRGPLKSMPQIRTLKPNVTREQAILQFSSTGIPRLLRNAAFGRLRSVAELYLPFRLLRVQITNRGLTEERLIALDAVSGTLDPFQFDHAPTEAETVSVETRNCPHAQLADALVIELLVAKLRRLLYSRGFFRMRDLQISATPIDRDLYIPYWLGFRGSDGHARVAVIDAMRRRFEGAKVRRLVETWLTSNH
jgi:hypothetical protein